MATDIEESDRISRKKQRTVLLQAGHSNETGTQNDYKNAGPSSSSEDSSEEEKRKKLREWQEWQVRKASEENSVNEMFSTITECYHVCEQQFQKEMNLEQAVLMAIQNHGLVSQPDRFDDNFFIDYRRDPFYVKPTDGTAQSTANVEQDSERDQIFDNDQQQDFLLEQAVSEAIKKKGLTALTVDYG